MGRRVGWSEMIADTWRQDAMERPEEFLSQHWSRRLLDTPLLLAIEVENHLENAEKYGAEKMMNNIIDLLSKQKCHDDAHGYGCAYEADGDYFIKLIKDEFEQ